MFSFLESEHYWKLYLYSQLFVEVLYQVAICYLFYFKIEHNNTYSTDNKKNTLFKVFTLYLQQWVFSYIFPDLTTYSNYLVRKTINLRVNYFLNQSAIIISSFASSMASATADIKFAPSTNHLQFVFSLTGTKLLKRVGPFSWTKSLP